MENVTPHNLKSAQRTRAMMPTPQADKESSEAPEIEVGANAKAFGNFAHNNRDFFTKNPIGNASYHFVRSAVACIPYGIGAAAVWTGKNKLLKTVAKDSKAAAVLNSPLLVAAQIAASFTFYRTGSFAMRRMHDRLFDEKNTREDTVREMSEVPTNFANDFWDNLKVQGHSVPWAALSLGYISQMGEADKEIVDAARDKPLEIITNKKARPKLLGQMGRNTIAYSVFFEVADTLGKHYRLQKGMADPTLHLSEHESEQGERLFKAEDPDRKYGAFTDEAGPFRLLLKRLPPAAVGIGAYTAAKRLGYRASISKKQAETFYDADKGANAFALDKEGSFLSTAWREGAATSLFGVYTFVKDPWEKAYDNFFEKLELKAKGLDEDLKSSPKNEVQKEDSQIDGTVKEAPIIHAGLT